jgi:hypothetical protein
MDQQVCSMCKHYQPSPDIEGCGVCSSEELWPARPQEVMADMCACAERGPQWIPLNVSTAASHQSTRPAWVRWLRWLGIIGLLLTPPIFIIDLFVGIPGLPELSILWLLLSLGVTAFGFLWGKI